MCETSRTVAKAKQSRGGFGIVRSVTLKRSLEDEALDNNEFRVGPDGLLPSGRHTVTMSEFRRVFVEEAPFRSERERIWRAFEIYCEMVFELLPQARLWVNGGFVTYKQWAAPGDIDVCVVDGRDALLSIWESLAPLLTIEVGQVRIQPMSGLVDGFAAPDHDTEFWDGFWSQVVDENRIELNGVSKGYVEVRNDGA